MGHPREALSAVFVRKVRKPGRYADGNCLHLVVTDSGKKWVVRTTINGKRCDVGVGSAAYTTLADAREKAAEIRRAARAGADPLTERRQRRAEERRHQNVPTFEAAARQVHAELAPSFRNDVHSRNWIRSFDQYVFPSIGERRVDTIESADVLRVLQPIWLRIPDTAKRTKQRMKAVLDWAKAHGHRTGDNPVDGIKLVLPKHRKQANHYGALPWQDVPAFVRELRTDAGISGRLAFEFLIVTAARTGEVIKARWAEIDFEAKLWTRPGVHMKAGREHKVPLSARAVEILREAKKLTDGSGYVFPGLRAGQPLSNMVFHATLKRMDKTGFTPHGFRSSFRDWAEEKTDHARRTVEASLAHEIHDKVEAAYLRTELLDKRRGLMAAWAEFVTREPKAKVVRMGA